MLIATVDYLGIDGCFELRVDHLPLQRHAIKSRDPLGDGHGYGSSAHLVGELPVGIAWAFVRARSQQARKRTSGNTRRGLRTGGRRGVG